MFRRVRVAVLRDGDSWHDRNWQTPRSEFEKRQNAAYWLAKTPGDGERASQNTALTTRQGWDVIRLWEADVRADLEAAAEILTSAAVVTGARLAMRSCPVRLASTDLRKSQIGKIRIGRIVKTCRACRIVCVAGGNVDHHSLSGARQ